MYLLFLCSTFLFAPALTNIGVAADASSSFQSSVLPVLKARCISCHGENKQKGEVKLSGPHGLEQLSTNPELWFRVLEQIESGKMPPEDEDQPSGTERETLIQWIRGDFTAHQFAKQRSEGRSKLRRLSRTEYANTVRDLFRLHPTVGLNLPEDGRVDGYDKVSAALPLSGGAAAGYFKMAGDILNWVLKPIPKSAAAPAIQIVNAFDPARTVRVLPKNDVLYHVALEDGTVVSFNSDPTSGTLLHNGARTPGIHRLRISAYAHQTDKPLTVGIYAGHTSAYPQILNLLQVLEVPPGKPAVIETEVYLRSRDLNDRTPVADRLRLVPMGLGVPVPKGSDPKLCTGPGLAVQWVDIEEPTLPLPADRWLTADFPKALDELMRKPRQLPAEIDTNRAAFLSTMRATFQRIGARLYRRDLTAAEMEHIMVDITRQIDSGVLMQTAFFDKVTELMTSPDFLCMIQPAGRLSDFALASRLSYFLWNSTPDEALMQIAREGKLHEPNVLREQTERLLNDPKSGRFVMDFVNQWLGLHSIDDTSPDHILYPEYEEFLKLSSAWETEGFFQRVLHENLSVRHFVDSPWAFVNERLAKFYGITGVTGDKLRKAELPADSPYGGLWTQSAVLKVTANGTNTSPVKRGRWVAERLLGIPIPPPPPNVKPVEPDVRGAKTLREQFALHSSHGSCTGCHAKFDPYGFAMESFDVTGRFRTHYREVNPEVVALPAAKLSGKVTWRAGLPVDCTGQTPDGKTFAGITELRKLLRNNPEQLARGVTRHLLTYATGTPPSALDQQAIQSILKNTTGDDYGLRSLIHALVQSELFLWK